MFKCPAVPNHLARATRLCHELCNFVAWRVWRAAEQCVMAAFERQTPAAPACDWEESEQFLADNDCNLDGFGNTWNLARFALKAMCAETMARDGLMMVALQRRRRMHPSFSGFGQ